MKDIDAEAAFIFITFARYLKEFDYWILKFM